MGKSLITKLIRKYVEINCIQRGYSDLIDDDFNAITDEVMNGIKIFAKIRDEEWTTEKSKKAVDDYMSNILDIIHKYVEYGEI